MINDDVLTPVRVSLTRLHPTMMPDIAKQQYDNLVKSSVLINVMPDDKTTLDTLSPETTPEREIRRTTRNADLLYPGIRTQLQVDLDTSFLGDDPWGTNSKPYPSPKTPDKEENSDSHGWSSISNKPCSFEDNKVDELSGNALASYNKELEAIMAPQLNQVPLKDFAIPVQQQQRQQHQRQDLQNVTIPMQPVDVALKGADKLSPPVTLFCKDSPVFDRKGIWTSLGSKVLQEGKALGTKTGRKRGRPRKRLHSFEETSLDNPMNVNNPDKSVTGLIRQESQQKNIFTERKDRSVERNEVRRKRGRTLSEPGFPSQYNYFYLDAEVALKKNNKEGGIGLMESIDVETPGSSGSTMQFPENTTERFEVRNKHLKENVITTPKTNKWLSRVKIESSPLIKSLKANKDMDAKRLLKTVFLRDQREDERSIYSKVEENNSHDLSIAPDRKCSVGQELFPAKENLNTITDVPNFKYRKRKPSDKSTVSIEMSLRHPENVIFFSSESKEVSPENTNKKVRRLSVVGERAPNTIDLEKNHICHYSPICSEIAYIEDTAQFVKRQGVSEQLSIDSKQHHNLYNSIGKEIVCIEDTAEEFENRHDVSGPFSCQEGGSSLFSRHKWIPELTLNKKKSNLDRKGQPFKLLEGKIRLTPCIPKQFSKSPLSWNKREKRIDSSSSDKPRLNSAFCLAPYSPVNSRQTSAILKPTEGRGSTVSSVALPRSFFIPEAVRSKLQLPLKDLVVKCDRLIAGNYNVLKCPESLHILHPQKTKRIRKKTSKVKYQDMAAAENKMANQKGVRKRKKKSILDKKEKKPRKKRRLAVPDHYKNFKPSQLPTIGRTSMRYRVAFALWPQTFSGALDKINRRLINQNSFWKFLE